MESLNSTSFVARDVRVRVPCLLPLLGLVCGVVLYEYGSLFVFAGVGLFVALLWGRERLSRQQVFLIVAFALVGLLRCYLFYDAYPAHHIRALGIEKEMLMRVRGVVIDDVLSHSSFLKGEGTEPTASESFHRNRLATFRVRSTGVINKVGERVLVRGVFLLRTASFLRLRYGDEIEVTGLMRPIRGSGNPASFDVGKMRAQQGVYYSMYVRSANQVRLLNRPVLTWLGFLYEIREYCARRLDVYLDGSDLALYTTVLLGNRSLMQQELTKAFRESGTMHLLSISGLHLVIWIAFVGWFLRVGRVPEKPSIVLLLVFTFLYVAMIGARSSSVRAGLMIGIYYGGLLLNRRGNSFNTLALSAMVLLLWKPGDFWSGGFLLSYVSVLGIVMYAHIFERFLVGDDRSDLEYRRLTGRVSYIEPLRRYFLRSLATSLAVMVLIFPLLWYLFNLVTVMGVVANVLGALGLVCMMVMGLSVLLVDLVLPPLAAVLGSIAEIFSSFLIKQVEVFAQMSWGHFYLPRPSGLFLLSYYCCVYFLWRGRLNRREYWRPVLFWGGVCVLTILLYAKGASLDAAGLLRLWNRKAGVVTVTMLYVGNGSSLVLECPGGEVFLYDCGSSGYRAVGRRETVPYLWSRGIRKLDGIVLSHPDSDHINGIPKLLEKISADTIYVTSQFLSYEKGRQFLDSLRRFDVSIRVVQAGDFIYQEGDVSLQVLHPKASFETDDVNATSMLVRLKCGRSVALFTGDLEDAGYADLSDEIVRADVLQVPHHGSNVDDFSALLKRIRPKLALLSSDAKFAQQSMVDIYAEQGVRVLHSAVLGMVQVELLPTGAVRYVER